MFNDNPRPTSPAEHKLGCGLVLDTLSGVTLRGVSAVPQAVEEAVDEWQRDGRPVQSGIRWPPEAWLQAFPDQESVLNDLPALLDRSAVDRAVRALPESEEGVRSALVIIMAWGFGDNGYGRHRVSQILSSPDAARNLLEATRAVRESGPIAGYTTLAGSARVKHLGPSFGTKFLYYQSAPSDRALILDRLLGRFLEERCGIRLDVARWSVPTYAEYYELMAEWGRSCQLEPDVLEMVLFTQQATAAGGQWATPDTVSSALARSGDPDEFDEELRADIREPDDVGPIEVPPGVMRQMLADPAHVAEYLAISAVERLADRASRDVRLIRERNSHATDRQLAVYFKKKYSRAARYEGMGTGVAGIFGLPADLVLLAWIQDRLVLSIAAIYGHDMSDHRERAAELLMIQGFHNSREVARRALTKATQTAMTKLVMRHLRKRALTVVKRLFKVVGITFTRKAFIEKGIPLVAIPLSAGLNEASTRILANQAIRFYDTEVT